jgi:branched-chain amino acid transport system substrate-binding protein
MQNAGSAEPASYLPELKKIRYQGVTDLVRFDQHGDVQDGSMSLFTYRGGKRTKLGVIH